MRSLQRNGSLAACRSEALVHSSCCPADRATLISFDRPQGVLSAWLAYAVLQPSAIRWVSGLLTC